MEDMSLHQLQMYTEGHTIGLSFRDALILSKGIGQASENHKVRVSWHGVVTIWERRHFFLCLSPLWHLDITDLAHEKVILCGSIASVGIKLWSSWKFCASSFFQLLLLFQNTQTHSGWKRSLSQAINLLTTAKPTTKPCPVCHICTSEIPPGMVTQSFLWEACSNVWQPFPWRNFS